MTFVPPPLFFDREGQPVEPLDWVERFADYDARFVAEDRVGGYTVTTMFLGVNAYDDDPPKIFGTLVRVADDVGDEFLYDTEREARDGHLLRVAECRVRVAAKDLSGGP